MVGALLPPLLFALFFFFFSPHFDPFLCISFLGSLDFSLIRYTSFEFRLRIPSNLWNRRLEGVFGQAKWMLLSILCQIWPLKAVLFSYVSSAPPRCGWDSFLDQHRHRDSLNGGDSKFMCLFIGLGSACLKISLSSFRLASSISEVQI